MQKTRSNSNWELVGKPYFYVPFFMVLLLGLVYLLDESFLLNLYEFGVYPRKKSGLLGIISSPFIHGDWDHLRNNAISFFALSAGLIYFYPRKALPVLVIAWLLSGIGVWFWARESYHIGASGIIYALAAFIFISGILRAHPNLLALSMLVVFLYGSFIWGMVPADPRISYEAHISGAVIGVLLAVYFRNSPPRDFPKAFAYEDIDDDLSREIELFGLDYWKQNTDSNHEIPVHYHYKPKDEKQPEP